MADITSSIRSLVGGGIGPEFDLCHAKATRSPSAGLALLHDLAWGTEATPTSLIPVLVTGIQPAQLLGQEGLFSGGIW
ncbi:hypothetical protein ATY75_22175 [Rhizobium sp. N122]|nr:hypothetical protein ATY75_22175 [Rhizobium sp. N122]